MTYMYEMISVEYSLWLRIASSPDWPGDEASIMMWYEHLSWETLHLLISQNTLDPSTFVHTSGTRLGHYSNKIPFQ